MECPEGSQQVMDQNECQYEAFNALKDEGYVNGVGYPIGTGSFLRTGKDHVAGCFEANGFWNGGFGNGNIFFSTNIATTGTEGYRICKNNTSKNVICLSFQNNINIKNNIGYQPRITVLIFDFSLSTIRVGYF